MNSEEKVINGGDLLIKCLLEENVKYLFGITGGQFSTMFNAVYQWGREMGINTVMFRHEQAAAHAADAWTRVTNTPGVCFGTVGPGATHLVPGIGAAWSDNIPVIAIVPQVTSRNEDSFALQGNLNQVALFKPITKYQKSVRQVDQIPDAVHKSFREATGGRPQPVLLEIYTEAFYSPIKESQIPMLSPHKYRAMGYPAAESEMVKKCIDMLLNADKPLIISGGGVTRSGAWNELQNFAEYLKIPVITTAQGLGTISKNSECLVDLNAASKADVVLALGCKFSFLLGLGREPVFKDSQKLIQVDIDPAIIGRAKPIELGIIADCKVFLKQLNQEMMNIDKINNRTWLTNLFEEYKSKIEKTLQNASDNSTPINPLRLVKEIYEFMDDDTILILDGGNIAFSAYEIINYVKPRPPCSTLWAIGMGHLGTSVPYGIGAKLAKPDTQTISISGDGSFMINIQDLETAVRMELTNLIYVVANNASWGMIKFSQQKIDVDFPDFNYAKCAEGFGCYGESVTDPNDLKSALERAKNSGKPAVIDVKTRNEVPDNVKSLFSLPIF